MKVTNVTATTVQLSWREPESFINILKYKIKATVLHTYSSFSHNTPEWMFSNDTFKTELIGLQPSTTYNVTINAVSEDGVGAAAWNVVQTHLAGNTFTLRRKKRDSLCSPWKECVDVDGNYLQKARNKSLHLFSNTQQTF